VLILLFNSLRETWEMCNLPLILLVIFYFIKTKSIFQGVFDYFNQISDELHYSRLCILLQNSSTFDFSGHTCGQNDSLRLFLRYKKAGQ